MLKQFKERADWCRAAIFATGIIVAGNSLAGEETLECTLYIALSMDSAATHMIPIEESGEILNTVRRASYCLFANGDVADKQFVMVNRILDGGKQGRNQGYSTYTMANGDSISAEFNGAWGETSYMGIYNILGGTGAYAGASGDGTLAGTKSPWKTTSVVKVVLNVNTP